MPWAKGCAWPASIYEVDVYKKTPLMRCQFFLSRSSRTFWERTFGDRPFAGKLRKFPTRDNKHCDSNQL